MKIKEKIQINETQLKILALFTNGYEKEHYVREVGILLHISPRTAQLNLEQLERAGVLESAGRGKIKAYFLRKNEMAREYIKLAEMFKAIRFLEKHELIREIIGQITPHIEGMGVVFGSYAKGTHKEDSDLDVFIVGTYNRKEIEAISDRYGLDVSVKNYSLAIFKRDIQKDLLIKEVIKNHVIFQGVEQFVHIATSHG